MKDKNQIDLWICRVGFGLVFWYCFIASIFYAYFAQIHLNLNFLPFPVFIGEILLFICLVMFLVVCEHAPAFSRQTAVLLSLYFGWVLVKSLINYYYDGPLTCRNAALYYYPVFAVFTYTFYQKAKIPVKWLMLLALLCAGILLCKVMIVWCWWMYIILLIIAVYNTKSAVFRWLGWIFLAAIFLLGKEYLYKGPRAHFVSVLGAVFFLIVYFGALLLKSRRYIILSIAITSFVFFIIGFLVFSNRDDIHSLTSLGSLMNTYKMFETRYKSEQINFAPQKLTVHLYNYKKFRDYFEPSKNTVSQPLAAAPTETHSSRRDHNFTLDLNEGKRNVMSNFFRKIKCSRIRDGRELDLNENNIIFRIFVWRDMASELIQQRAWWGFSFGHPQRSRSLEVLHWAESEWSRDGWITPHNSFFHIIYRAGILGVLFIGVLFFMVGKLVRDFYRMDSFEGGFLVSGLVYWMVLSNFFVILEFPYNAIIFWTLFGITLAYRDKIKSSL